MRLRNRMKTVIDLVCDPDQSEYVSHIAGLCQQNEIGITTF